VSITVQLQTVLFMSVCGALMAMGFDTYHVFKGKGRFPPWLVFLLDVLFWIGSMALVFFILVQVNDGVVRFPIFLGMLFGSWIYFLVGSKKYIQFLLAVIKFCQWLYRTVLMLIDTLIVRPILFLYRLVWMLVTFLFSVLMTILTFFWKIVKFLSSPFTRWGQQMGKRIRHRGKGIWTNWKNWLHSKKKQE
jgi:spore cortex biosynthesis protein YabQ